MLLAEAEERNDHMLGASTCSFLNIDNDKNDIYGCNIGDSGFVVFRKDDFTLRTIIRTENQWHDFDKPYTVS